MGTALPTDKPKVNVPALEKLMSNNNLDQAAEQFEAYMAKLRRPIPRDGSGKPQPVTTTALLSERGKTHGDYKDGSRITQGLKATLYQWYTDKHTCAQREALEMIQHKIGRILAGDPDFRDHWDDIAGYAKLVAEHCSK